MHRREARKRKHHIIITSPLKPRAIWLNSEILKSLKFVIQTWIHEKCPLTFNSSKGKRHYLYHRNLSEKDVAFMAFLKFIPLSNSSSSV
jgi:hypothetical protein